jgi:hypothetical protein
MERAFKFLKSTSVNGGAVAAAAGDGLAADDIGGAVLSGDALGDAAISGAEVAEGFTSGRSSCAGNAVASKHPSVSVRIIGRLQDRTVMARDYQQRRVFVALDLQDRQLQQ